MVGQAPQQHVSRALTGYSHSTVGRSHIVWLGRLPRPEKIMPPISKGRDAVLSLSLLDLSLSHASGAGFAKTQAELVRALQGSQVLKTPRVSEAFGRVDRAVFLPSSREQATYAEPYVNAPQQLVGNATLSTPHHHALVVEALYPFLRGAAQSPKRVLDLGCGSGYLVAVFADLLGLGADANQGSIVVGLDRVAQLVDLAGSALDACPVTQRSRQVGSVRVANPYNQADAGPSSSRLGNVDQGLAPWDVIHVGFAVTPEDVRTLTSPAVLRASGALLAPVVQPRSSSSSGRSGEGDNEDSAQALSLFKSDGTSAVLARTACQPMELGMLDVASAAGPSIEEQEAELRSKLDAWKTDFAASHSGRAPTREEMFADPIAGRLFKEFATLRRRKW